LSNIGLKLWSSNIHYHDEIDRLWALRGFDYIEVYIEPGSTEYIQFWRKKGIPYIIHCAHSMHGFNLSLKENVERNKALFNEAYLYYKSLDAEYIIIHPGVFGDKSETISQINFLFDNYLVDPADILIDNKTSITLTDDRCVGSDPDDIMEIIKSSGVGFCLDITHAVKYSIAENKSWVEVLNKFMKLNPSVIHISDAHSDHPKDEHLHNDSGDFVFTKILSICSSKFITIETEKDSRKSLSDFELDRSRLIKYLNEE
jgi:endonuclease IV